MAVTPGDKLYGYTKVYRGTGATQTQYLRYYWYDKDKVAISPSYNSPQINEAIGNGGTLAGVVTVPAGAVYTRFTVVATPGTGGVGFYNMTGNRQTGSVLIEDGAVTATQINASSVGAAVGAFVKLDVKDLIVTGTGTMDSAAVLKLSSEVATVIDLGVERLVANSANMSTAVADKMFSNIFATNQLMANQIVVGAGLNVVPDPGFISTALNAKRTTNSQQTVTVSAGGDLSLTTTTTGNQYFRVMGNTTSDLKSMIPVEPGQVWRFRATVTAPAGGSSTLQIATRTKTGTTATTVTGSTLTGTGVHELEFTVASNVYYLHPEIRTSGVVGTFTLVRNTLSLMQKADNSLIVNGGVTAEKITFVGDGANPNEAGLVGNFAKIMKLDVKNLTVTGVGNMEEAVIDKLWADVVRAKKITTDMLIVSAGSNLIPDANMMDPKINALKMGNTTGWTELSATQGKYLRYNSTATTAQTAYYNFMPVANANQSAPVKTDWIAVMEGEKYLIRVHWYQYALVTGHVYVNFERGDGTVGSTQFADVTGTGHKQVDYEWTAPAGARFAVPRLQLDVAAGTTVGANMANVYADFTAVIKKQDASLIVDGAIVATKITASEELWTKVLDAHKIKAVEIDTNDLQADTGFVGAMRTNILTADVVTSTMIHATNGITSKHTITGPLIQTSATALRGVKISTTLGLKAYNNTTGATTFSVDPTTGNMVATGTTQTSIGGSRVVTWDRGDGTAAVDLYTDGTGVHGSLYTQPHTANGLYVTNLMHYTGSPISTTNWTSRVTLFQDETWAIGQRTKAAEIAGDANGQIYFRGKLTKNNSAATETFVVGTTVASQAATGTYALTYAAPVPTGTRTVLASANASWYVQHATQSETASGFSWIWSTGANSTVSMRFFAVWTT
jgi:hypothetical protein